MRKKLSNKKGVTLVEVMVAVALVTVIVSTVAVTVAQSAVNANRLDMIYTASNLAKKHMDDLKAMSFRDLPDEAPETNVRINAQGEADSGGDYMRSTEVDEAWGSNAYLTKIKVSVDRIVDSKVAGHSVVMETLFAEVE